HGMVWGVGSDAPSAETETEQCDLVADDVRHDPLPGTFPGQDCAVRAGRADEFDRRPGPPGLSRPSEARRAMDPERRRLGAPLIRVPVLSDRAPRDRGLAGV